MREVAKVYALDGDKWKCGKHMYRLRPGGGGLGVNYRNVGYTVNTVDRHIVAICRRHALRPAYVRRVCDGSDGSVIGYEERGIAAR